LFRIDEYITRVLLFELLDGQCVLVMFRSNAPGCDTIRIFKPVLTVLPH
jgi:hypothetical protein